MSERKDLRRRLRGALDSLVRAVAVSGLEPVIDRVFDFGEVKAAFEHLHGARHLGKIVIRTD